MKNRNVEEFIMDFIDGKISRAEMEKILNDSGDRLHNLDELEGMKNLYSKLDSLPAPEPGENMDKNFYNMLESISAVTPKSETINPVSLIIKNIVNAITLKNFAYASLILILGIFVGKWVLPENDNNQLNRMSSELKSIKEVMALTLLQQPSATQRIKAVSYVDSVSTVDSKLTSALIETLNTDNNVNVRLATIDALSRYVDSPLVREGLIRSIANQKSPVVQVALADLMASIHEKKSVEPLKQLLADKNIKNSVKTKIENCITRI
jgi:hypothetical protein